MSNTLVDSLLYEVQQTEDPEKRSDIYIDIAHSYYPKHVDSLLIYYDKALEEARKTASYEDDILHLRYYIHLYGNRINEYELAKQYVDEAIAIAVANNDIFKHASLKNSMGIIAQNRGDFQLAVGCYFKALQLIENEDDDDTKMRIFLSLGIIHNETSYNEKAKSYYQEALKMAGKVGHQTMEGVILNNLAVNQKDIKDYTGAEDFLHQAYALFDSLDNNYWKGLVNYNFGNVSFLKGDYERALTYYNLSIESNKISNDRDREVMLLAGMSEVYLAQQKYSKAINLALDGLELIKEIKTTNYSGELNAILGKAYLETGNTNKASYHLHQCLQIKEKEEEKKLANKVSNMQALYEQEVKNSKIRSLESKLETDKIKQQKTSLLLQLSLVSLVLLFAIFGLLFYRNKLKETNRNAQVRDQLNRDLHDNIGSSLTHLKLLLSKTIRKSTTILPELKIAQNISGEMISNMYDLVWSLDTKKSKMEDLLQHMRDHASNVLSPLDAPFHMKIDNHENNKSINSELKNNVYSIFKEAINNIVKHTEPSEILITVTVQKNEFKLFIQNDKKNLKNQSLSAQRGIKNMKSRSALINGALKISDFEDKFIVNFSVKLKT